MLSLLVLVMLSLLVLVMLSLLVLMTRMLLQLLSSRRWPRSRDTLWVRQASDAVPGVALEGRVQVDRPVP
jgi:hypothetical protein